MRHSALTLGQRFGFWYVERFALDRLKRLKTVTRTGLRVITTRFDREFEDPQRPGTMYRYETMVFPLRGWHELDCVRTSSPAAALEAHRGLHDEYGRQF